MQNQLLWTALVTPFNATGNCIDYTSLESLLHQQSCVGNGVILFGSTGEGLAISQQERQQIITFSCNLGLKIPLMVGVPSYNLDAALSWLAFCRDLPLAGYLMTTPIYSKPGIKGQTAWFEKLLDAANHPGMLYNIPGRAGINLHPETVSLLQHHPKFQAIKDSSGNAESVTVYRNSAPDVAIYCGDDYMMSSMAKKGVAGLVSVTSNAWPSPVRDYVQDCLDGNDNNSDFWYHAGKAMLLASNPIPIKSLLKSLNLISHATVRLPLSLEDLPSIRPLLELHSQLKDLFINVP
jgi:4-hydroxy-tetrahydrodipicolinate synthase